jgi:hypothetical protein
MIIPLFAIALAQLTPQQKATENQLKQWVQDHQVEIKQRMDHINQVKALTYDQALIVYDQCLARAAASLDTVPADDVFNRAHGMCLPLRAELPNGRPSQWFLGFNDLDSAKRASFPALTKQLRERLGSQAATQETPPHN